MRAQLCVCVLKAWSLSFNELSVVLKLQQTWHSLHSFPSSNFHYVTFLACLSLFPLRNKVIISQYDQTVVIHLHGQRSQSVLCLDGFHRPTLFPHRTHTHTDNGGRWNGEISSDFWNTKSLALQQSFKKKSKLLISSSWMLIFLPKLVMLASRFYKCSQLM